MVGTARIVQVYRESPSWAVVYVDSAQDLAVGDQVDLGLGSMGKPGTVGEVSAKPDASRAVVRVYLGTSPDESLYRKLIGKGNQPAKKVPISKPGPPGVMQQAAGAVDKALDFGTTLLIVGGLLAVAVVASRR